MVKRCFLRSLQQFLEFIESNSKETSIRTCQLWKSNRENVEDASTLDTFSLEMFENIAYVMVKHADANIPDTPEEWLDGFYTFSIYQVLPQLIELWGLNVQTYVSAKKVRPTDCEMTTPLFLLRCVQFGISIWDLDLLTIGLVNDMFAENSNDDYKGYREVATQDDFNKF